VEILSRHLRGRSEEHHETLVTRVGVPSEVRNEHLPNASLEHYRYTILHTLVLVSTDHLSRDYSRLYFSRT
jgi:hypothetical protein